MHPATTTGIFALRPTTATELTSWAGHPQPAAIALRLSPFRRSNGLYNPSVPDLSEVSCAGGPLCFCTGVIQNRQENACQNCNDRNDGQKFTESEIRFFHSLLPFQHFMPRFDCRTESFPVGGRESGCDGCVQLMKQFSAAAGGHDFPDSALFVLR